MGVKDKVLFVSHHREDSGWGRMGRGYINAFLSAGYDVAARPVILGKGYAQVDDTVLKAEQNSSYGCKYLVQHLLPHQMEYSGEFEKCVGIVDLDSHNLLFSGWLDKLSLMDEVWTPNTDCTSKLSKEIDRPVKTVPHAFDMSPYSREYERANLELPESTYKFYTICDVSRRKNLAAIIKAFHLAFPTDADVALVIKATKHGMHPDQIYNEINDFCLEIQRGLKLYKDLRDYRNNIIIPDQATDESIYRLHKNCDCYVSASYGEAWCIPAFDAMAFGNPVIASNVGGPKDYLKDLGALCGGRYEPCFGMMDSFETLFTAHERWFNINVDDLVQVMQNVYNLRPVLGQEGLDRANEYSYSSVGKIIRNIL